MTVYYNEVDSYAAAWLQNLILEGVIAPGHVDTRSIEDVTPNDLAGFTQCHFFAGIGVWSYALRLAGWPDDRAVWTGSCPCQPFSAAGKGLGVSDERHLWPAWFHLIELCRPPVVFGEQVASPDGRTWFQTVHADMERACYAVGVVDLCAAGVGAPHYRQRLYYVADDEGQRPERRNGKPGDSLRWTGPRAGAERHGATCELGDADDTGPQGRGFSGYRAGERAPRAAGVGSHWSEVEWVLCDDRGGPRWRPVEPGTFPLAHGAPARVGRLRAYGNAINAEVAKEFIASYLEC